MSNYFPTSPLNTAVNPVEIWDDDGAYNLIDQHICFNTSHRTSQTPHYQDEIFAAGQQRIGLGNCAICMNASNNCVLISNTPGALCGHLICSTCAGVIQGSAGTCPFCRQYIHHLILVDFS